MIRRVISACIFIAVGCVAAEARPYRMLQASECNVTMPCDFSYAQPRRERAHRVSVQDYRSTQMTMTDAGNTAPIMGYAQPRRERTRRASLQAYRSAQMTVTDAGNTAPTIIASSSRLSDGGGRVIGGRPAGCPHSFCGCGAAIRVFGHIVPELNLASNWLRFPRAAPAPGMVAARHGHVFVLEQHLGGDMWMAYDANSGGHATRMHARSLRGYTVVNPRA